MPHNKNPAVCLNRKCDEIANVERACKREELNLRGLNLNTTVTKNSKSLIGNVKKRTRHAAQR